MRSLISLTFDDGFRCQFERALPTLNRYGLPATFFLIANKDSTHDRSEGHSDDWWKIDWRDDDITMLKKLVQDGYEIGSHSVTHHRTQMREQPEVEAFESKKLIEGWLGTMVSSFCYPFYRSHEYLVNAVRAAGYDQARGGGAPPVYGALASYYTIPDNGSLDMFNVHCREISNNENVGEWVRPECWHILTYHGIGSDQDGWKPISVEQFGAQMAELAKYRDSGAVEVVTFKDAAGRFRQPN